MPGDIYDIVVVQNDSDRSTQFPTPGTNQRVQNLGTSNIERYNGSAWVTDFLGDTTIIYNPSTTDYGPAIQAAIASANSAGGGTVTIPAGTWPVLTPISFGSATNVTLRGVGNGTTLALAITNSTYTTGIDASLTQHCTIRDCRITGSGTTVAIQGLVSAVNASSNTYTLTIERVRFEGGPTHIAFQNCWYATVSNTTHNGLTLTGAECIAMSSCHYCSLINPIVEQFAIPQTSPVTASMRLIEINSSYYISVTGGSITNVDMSYVTGGGAGISFSGASQCTLTGMTVSGLVGADGVLCESNATDIAISNVVSSYNGTTQGPGGQTGVGDGFDIFNSSAIRLTNCIAYNNGTATGTGVTSHPGFEIYTCADVKLVNCLSQANGTHGYVIVGCPDISLTSCIGNLNGASGLYAVPSTGNVAVTDLRIIGGDFSANNNATGTGKPAYTESGIYLAGASAAGTGTVATIIGARATDYREPANQKQLYNIYVANNSSVTIIGCQTLGFATGGASITNNTTGTVAVFGGDTGQPTVSGSKGGNAALTSLCTVLGQLNIINNQTT